MARHTITLDDSVLGSILEAARGTRLEVPLQVSALTGMRRGELLALKWSGVDFDRKKIIVSQSVEETQLFGCRLKETKSGHIKVVPMADVLVPILEAHKKKQAEEIERIGDRYQRNDLVFCNEDGSIWPPNTLTKQFSDLRRLLGQETFRLHDVRHAFASSSLDDGTPITVVSELLGHSSPAVTMTVYAHAIQGRGREAVNRLAKRVLGRREAEAV